MRIFVIGPGAHSYEGAKEYGELILVLGKGENPFQTSELYQRLKGVFDDSRASREDALLLGGNATLNGIAAALWGARFGLITLVIYGAKKQDYTVRTVQFAPEPGGA